MEISLPSWHSSNAGSFQAVVQKFSPNQGLRDIIVLELKEESGLGGSGRGERFGCCERIKKEGEEGNLLGKWR